MLTISICKLSLSNTQYIIKTASRPLFYLYQDLNLSVCYPDQVFLIKIFWMVICKMKEKLQWFNMNSSILNTNPCFFFLQTCRTMHITSTSSKIPPPAMPALVPTDSPSSAEEQLLDHDLILTAYTLFVFYFLNWYGHILWNVFIRQPRGKLINSWYWTHIYTISSMIYFFICFTGAHVPLANFSLIWRRHHYRRRAPNFNLYSAIMAIEQWKFISIPHLLWHGASVYNAHLRGPVTLKPVDERLAVELLLIPVFTT